MFGKIKYFESGRYVFKIRNKYSVTKEIQSTVRFKKNDTSKKCFKIALKNISNSHIISFSRFFLFNF